MEIVIAVVAGVLGLLAGGVVNALADDLPAHRDPSLPHYPDGTPRPPSAWLGLMAFLTGQREAPSDPVPAPEAARPPVSDEAGGAQPDSVPEQSEVVEAWWEEGWKPQEPPKSRRLSWRHPLVEVLLALGFVAVTLGFGGETNLPVWLVWLAVMLLITVIDIEHHLILFSVIIPSSALALVVAAVSPEQGRPFIDFVVGGLVGFFLFYLMFLGGGLFSAAVGSDEVAFGFGDVLLATLSGLILGWQAFIFATMITVFVGAAGALLYVAARAVVSGDSKWFMAVPYGPYIVIGTLVMLLFSDEVKTLLQGG